MSTHLSHPKYRPDIDGLRAIAVLSVVTFHAFPDWLRGGFVGVDIFFVISGYLISSIIIQNVVSESFSFVEFYERRINRIFPGLLLVMLSCFVFGWFSLLPDEFAKLGKHILGGAVFLSNILLLRESGYFDLGSNFKPLLHLWSLGVEEQYYFIWPIVVLMANKVNVKLIYVAIAIFLLSFSTNIADITVNKTAAFYSPIPRFWELMAGSILAWLAINKPEVFKQGSFADIASVIGIILIILANSTITQSSNFPGWLALLPVFGAILLIYSGPYAVVNKMFLSNKLLVWIGLISYPLYLWHWPLLSFSYIVNGGLPSIENRGALLILSVLLAWFTYTFVEKKVRYGKQRHAIALFLLGVMVVFGLVGGYTFKSDGFVFRYASTQNQNDVFIKKFASVWKERDYPLPPAYHLNEKYKMVEIGENQTNKVLFIGDSHVKQYLAAIDSIYHKNNYLKTHVSTLVYYLLDHQHADYGFPPVNLDRRIYTDLSIKTVVFSYFWTWHYGGERVDQADRCCGNGVNGMVGYFDKPFSSAEEMDVYDEQFVNLIRKLINSGKQVWIVMDNPFGTELAPQFLVDRRWNRIMAKPITKLKKVLLSGVRHR